MTSVILILESKRVLYKRYYWKIINQNAIRDYVWVMGLWIIFSHYVTIAIFATKFSKFLGLTLAGYQYSYSFSVGRSC